MSEENKLESTSSTEERDKELKIEHVNQKSAPKFYKDMKLAVLNGAVITNLGAYVAFPIPLESARLLAHSMEIESFIGHESTAKTLSKLLKRPIEYRREELNQNVGQMALVFKLMKRAPEGQVLTKKELEEIGYEFLIVYRTK